MAKVQEIMSSGITDLKPNKTSEMKNIITKRKNSKDGLNTD